MLLKTLVELVGMIRSLVKLSCILWLLFDLTVFAASDGISGSVRDSEGAAVEKAHVFVRADASGRREPVKDNTVMLETDKDGHFSASLNPGFYDVCVMADAFSPQCEKVFVQRQPVLLEINLKADPEVMKRLGDRF